MGIGNNVPMAQENAVAGDLDRSGTILPTTGWATFYSAGVFDTVLRNQIRYGNVEPNACPECLGYVALLWPDDLGRTVCVEVNGETFGPYLVADAASGRDRPGLIADGWVLDAQYTVWFDQWNLPRNPTRITVIECES